MMFRDRYEAGRKLVPALKKYENQKDAIVIGLPRGGVVTAYEVARHLHLPLDIVCPRKVGSPYNPELAIGAVTHTGACFFNDDIIRQLEVSKDYMAREVAKEKKVSEQRQQTYRKGRPPLDIKGKIVILVDDGLATGATMKAAIQWVRSEKANQVVVAVPVSPPETLVEVEAMADDVVCLYAPPFFQAVGQFYENFSQTTDEEVLQLLQE